MVQAIARRSFLMGQEELDGGKKKDIIAKKGEKMKLSERDAIKFWGALKFTEADEARLLKLAKTQKLTRVV